MKFDLSKVTIEQVGAWFSGALAALAGAGLLGSYTAQALVLSTIIANLLHLYPTKPPAPKP